MAFMGAVAPRLAAIKHGVKSSFSHSVSRLGRRPSQIADGDQNGIKNDRRIESDDQYVFTTLPYQARVKAWYDSYSVQLIVVLLIVGNFITNILNAQYLITASAGAYEGLRGLLEVLEIFFVGAFTIELLVNIYGSFIRHFLAGPDAAWNWFDAIVVALSLMSLGTNAVPGVSALRTFRAFRILRLFKRVESLKLIIEGVLASLPGVSYAFLVLIIMMMVYSIMGVDFFRTESSVNFDGDEMFGDFPKAMFTMVQCLTTDGWIDYMSRPLGLGPHDKPQASFFFVSYVFLTCFVMSNVIVAILLQEYLTKVQEMAKDGSAARVEKTNRKHENFLAYMWLPHQERVYQAYQKDRVQIAVACLIFCNFIVNAANAWVVPKEGSDQEKLFWGLDVFFSCVFGIELMFNMYGNWWREFLHGSLRYWNIFDFVTVVSSILALAAGNIKGISMLRLLRAARVFRLFKRVPELRMLVEAIIYTFPAVLQTFAILLIFMSIWAIMGVEFFGDAKQSQFGNFAKSLLTMWQVLTVDSWSTIARELIYDHDMWASSLFFVSFIFLNSIVMSNVVIAVLLEGYLKASHDLALEAKAQSEKLAHTRENAALARSKSDMQLKEVMERRSKQAKILGEVCASKDIEDTLSFKDYKAIWAVLNKHAALQKDIEEKFKQEFGSESLVLKLLTEDEDGGEVDLQKHVMERVAEVTEMREMRRRSSSNNSAKNAVVDARGNGSTSSISGLTKDSASAVWLQMSADGAETAGSAVGGRIPSQDSSEVL